MKKLYIATVMKDKTREQIIEDMRVAAIKCKFDPDTCEFVNLLTEEQIQGKTPVQCLGLALMTLPLADVVIINKPGSGRGVCCEEYICNKYHYPFIKIEF